MSVAAAEASAAETAAPSLDPTKSVRLTLRGLTSVVGPGTAVTALLYYFGWARTSYQARQLGLDESLLGYSIEDYLLRSLPSMFWPLMIGLVTVLGGLALHRVIVARASSWLRTGQPGERARRQLRWFIWALLGLALTDLAYCATTTFTPNPTRFESLTAPLSAALAIVAGGYAAHLYHRFLSPHQRGGSPELELLRQLSGSIVVTLLFITLLWAVSHYAAVKGVALAHEVERRLPTQPDVTLVSSKRLWLEAPITETAMPDGDGYAYSGLKFLFLANHRYFLRPSDVGASYRNVVIPEGSVLQLELARR